jgi:branched-chain amino acid transport system substrate-binding protein
MGGWRAYLGRKVLGRKTLARTTASVLLPALVGSVIGALPALADYKVGFITSMSGAAATIGVPYHRGIAAAHEYMPAIGGEPITVIELDDGSDPSAATRDARKLIEEDKVDILVGTATSSSSMAIAGVANELKVPFIGLSPIKVPKADDGQLWALGVTQPPPLMVKVVADRISKDGVKKLAYIGYSEAWGDFVYNGAKADEKADGFQVVTNERYARTDSSVMAQTLKIIAAQPEGVLDGGSGTQGALPLLSLAERGYKGKIYGTPALVNADFIRVGGKAAEGIICSGGPVIVADQLPDDHYAKKIALAFREAHLKANGVPSTDSFAPYAFDSWLIFADAAPRAKAKAQPGTPEFHAALREALFSVKDLAGTQGFYNFTPASSYGVDERALVLMKLVDGKWVYLP